MENQINMMDDQVLWGDSQVPDARIITPNWYGDNENLPQQGSQVELLPEHLIELKKCKESIHYFAENYYTITVGGNEKQLMKLWDIQSDALTFFQENNRIVMNSSRQTSKTTLVVLFVLWNLIFGEGLQVIGMLGNKYELAKLNLSKVKEAYEYLPMFMKPHIERWNEQSIKFTSGNECKITSTSSTSFRGSTLTSLVIDEAAFVNEGGKADLDKEILQSLLPTLDAMGLGDSDDNSFCILVSTPYGMNNEFARLYHQAKEYMETQNPKKRTPFRAFEMLWSDHPKRDQQWFEDKVAEMGSEEAFYVEFGGSFTMGDGAKRAIDNEIKNFIKENYIQDPILTQTKLLDYNNDEDDQSFKIWKFPERGRIYSAGVDVAEGVDGCYSTIEIFDITNLDRIEQVAEYRNNLISTAEFALVCLKVFNAYNQCWASVEQNNSGREVIYSLVMAHGYRKLTRYHTNATGLKRMKENDEFGIISHNSSKNKSVSNFRHFLNTAKCVIIRSATLLAELDGFIQEMGQSNNWKWHKQGGSDSYDDTVDAFSWCLFPLHSQHVRDYYDVEEFNQYSKPISILGEVWVGMDHRRDNIGMPINQNGNTPSIYTDQGALGFDQPAFDLDWLQNF